MASDYDAEASRLYRMSPNELRVALADLLRAAHEAGAREMRERAACEAGDALAERGYHFGGVVVRIRALPTEPAQEGEQ